MSATRLNFFVLIRLLIRVILGFLCAALGFLRLIQPVEQFELILYQYRLIPEILVGPLAIALPWLQLILGVFLLLGYRERFSIRCLRYLITIFLVLLGAAIFLHTGIRDSGLLVSVPVRVPESFVILTSIIGIVFPALTSGEGAFSLDRLLDEG